MKTWRTEPADRWESACGRYEYIEVEYRVGEYSHVTPPYMEKCCEARRVEVTEYQLCWEKLLGEPILDYSQKK